MNSATRDALDWLFGRKVDVSKERTFKHLPHNPPHRGTIVAVEGVRCRVTRAKVTWDGPEWTSVVRPIISAAGSGSSVGKSLVALPHVAWRAL